MKRSGVVCRINDDDGYRRNEVKCVNAQGCGVGGEQHDDVTYCGTAESERGNRVLRLVASVR